MARLAIMIKSNITLTLAAKLCQVTKSMLSKWIKAKEDMENIVKSKRRCVFKMRVKSSTSAWYPEEEKKLYEKVVMMRKVEAVAVPTLTIQHMMLKMVEEKQRGSDGKHFKASLGWFSNWVRRFNLTFRKPTHMVDGDAVRQAEKDVQYDMRMKEFKKEYARLMNKEEYEDDRIWNMDETPVLLDPVFNKVNERE